MSEKPFDGGDPHGIVYNPEHVVEHASAVLLAKDMADYLETAYPGWLWAIEVDPRGGVCNLRSLRLSGEWGYVMKMDWVQHEPSTRKKLVLAAAGEILERFGMKAGKYDYAAWKAGPRDVAGDPKPDLSDKTAKVRRHHRDYALTRAVARGEVTVQTEDSGNHRRILIAGGYRNREREDDVRRS